MRKNKIKLIIIIACSSLLLGCHQEKTIEAKEKVDGISNTKEIPDNLIIIDVKPSVESQKTGNTDNIAINDEEVTPNPVDTIDVGIDVKNTRFYEESIKHNSTKLNTYKAIESAIRNHQKRFSIPVSNDSQSISEVFEYVKLDYPEYFYIPTSYKVITTTFDNVISSMEIELEYEESVWKLSEINKYSSEIELVASAILAHINHLNSDYHKILFIYEYLAKNIRYESDSIDDYSLYGALINKKATCEGYSEAFHYLLNQLGLDVITVVGKSKGQAHQWNMAKIDGLWYYFDATWDSPVNSSKYLPYNYFAINLNDVSKTHTLTHANLLPLANSNKHNYYLYNGLVLQDYDEASLLKMSKRSLQLNPSHISFKILNNSVFESTVNGLSTWIPIILERLNIQVSEISYTLNKELKIIDIYLKED